MNELLSALALMLIIEGLMPLVSPSSWREVFSKLLALSDGQIRFVGLASLLMGAIGLLLLR
ncbi:MAG: DUF2065 domain-containing protein [Roseateles depolymerans]|uniref:DUF2065 domain-containing protein n=1 Tax=Roseateles depolymerans TaxID=76731 RepID=A0A2W5DWU3_9BURK|nr:MAG: DUF2065 domain-containing protein [Roseateles depolymerans]